MRAACHAPLGSLQVQHSSAYRVRDLLRLLLDLVHLAANETFYREKGVLRVDYGLTLGNLQAAARRR